MKTILALISVLSVAALCSGASRPDRIYEIFQFPQDQIPRIDGDFEDWDDVPDAYAIGLSELRDVRKGPDQALDPADFDLSVKVAWVKGMNRLYFLYEATDNYWDFARPGLKNDIFEVVVDADLSGGPFIYAINENQNLLSLDELRFKGHGAHAQNYHVFTPSRHKDWAMVWGNSQWIKEFPHANAASTYSFRHGESGAFKMEFYITVYDHADPRGPSFSTESSLTENELIGLGWAILEYDNDESKPHGFMTLAHDREMVRNASALCGFRLMPLEKRFRRPIEAAWTFAPLRGNPRLFSFEDQSYGNIDSWEWDFGDGSNSREQHPIHQYQEAGQWVVTLKVTGPNGSDTLAKVWDIMTP